MKPDNYYSMLKEKLSVKNLLQPPFFLALLFPVTKGFSLTRRATTEDASDLDHGGETATGREPAPHQYPYQPGQRPAATTSNHGGTNKEAVFPRTPYSGAAAAAAGKDLQRAGATGRPV